MRSAKHFPSDERRALMFGLDPDELHAATAAVWSLGNPQTMPRWKAEDYALTALIAAAKERGEVSEPIKPSRHG